eukprot:99455_1
MWIIPFYACITIALSIVSWPYPKCPSTDRRSRDWKYICQTGCASGGCPSGWSEIASRTLGETDIDCVNVTNELCEKYIPPHIILSSLQWEDATQQNEQWEDSTQQNEQWIGWVNMISCNESASDSTFQYYTSIDDIKNLLPYVISVKIVPQGGYSWSTIDNLYNTYTVEAKICSNQILALNQGKEFSYQTDGNRIVGYSNLNDWIGSDAAKMRLENSCYAGGITTPRDVWQYMYAACNNMNGIHISPESQTCLWDWDQLVGHNIQIWFGFDMLKQKTCSSNGLSYNSHNVSPYSTFGIYKLLEMNVIISVIVTTAIILCLVCVLRNCYSSKKGYEKVKQVYVDGHDEESQLQ